MENYLRNHKLKEKLFIFKSQAILDLELSVGKYRLLLRNWVLFKILRE